MKRELCIIHANCQGDPLVFLLQNSAAFSARYDIVKYTNYTKEPVPSEALQKAELFVFQRLSEEWSELATEALLNQLNPRALALEIPNQLFMGYWPFWRPTGPINFSDTFLDHLVDKGLNHTEALHVCLRSPLEKMYDLEAIYNETIRREHEKQHSTIVRPVELVEKLWKQEKLFTTVNHPSPRLLVHVANGILRSLDMPELDQNIARQCPLCDDAFELPIHPRVGSFFGLAFANETTRYATYGKRLTYAQYAACYLDCRMQGIDNFIGYLHSVPMS